MATVLSQQLQQLSLQRGAVAPTTKGKATLLFDNQAAADVDLQTLHGIATVGLKKLAARDGRYLPFLSGLFSEASLQTPSREQQSEEWNQELNDTVSSFLRLLSIHFLLPPAFQVLEYLVRKYKINEYNVDGVMECILPYHATNEFVRVVQILRLKNTIWSSLSKAQETGAALPRDVLVQRCCVDRAILKFICEAAKVAASPSYTNKTMLSFYTVVVFEVLGKSKQVNEELVGFLLPYALEGLKANAMTDHRHASYTIIARLTSVVALSGSLISLLVEQLIAAGQPDETPAILRLLAHMASTQGELKSISGKSLKRLVSLPGFAHGVAELAGLGGRAGPLLRLLLKSLAGRVLSGRAWAAAALLELAGAAPLADHTGALATQLLQGVPDLEQDGEATQQAITKVLRALDLRYSEQLDQAINDVLAAAGAPEQGAAEGADSRRAAVFEFVRTAFEHSMHATMGAGADRAVTLSVALDAPAAGMRAEAVKHLDEVFVASSLPEQRAFATASLLRKLRDDDLAVVSAALSSRAVASAAPAVLLDELRVVLANADKVLLAESGREKAKLRAARDVTKKALQLLVTSQQDHPEGHMVAAAHLLDHMLVTPRGRDVMHAAVALARTSHGPPLFSRLSEVPLPAHDPAPTTTSSAAAPSGESAQPKKAKKHGPVAPEQDMDVAGASNTPTQAATDAMLNSGVIESLAQAVAHNLGASDVSALPALAAAGGPLCRHVLVLAMTRAAALVDRKDAVRTSWLPTSLATGLHAVFRSDWPLFQDALPSQFFASPSWKRLAPGSEEHLGLLATAAGRRTAHASALQLAMLHVAGQSLVLQNQQIFAEVAQLEPQAAFEAHLRKLLPAVGGVMGAAGDVGTALQQLQYLSEFFGGAEGAWPEAVVVRALQCAVSLLQKNAAAVAAMPLLRVVLCVLMALCSASGKVRTTAAATAPAMVPALLVLAADSTAAAVQCGEGITAGQAASALAAVLASVPGYAAEIAASPSAITQRLSSFLSPSTSVLGASQPADTAVAATPTKKPPAGAAETPASARRSRRGKPAGQAMEVEGAAAPLAANHQQLTDNGRALRTWMLHALRDCHAGAAGMAAAACLVGALAATPACHEPLVNIALGGDPPALPIRRALLVDEQSPLAADAVKPNPTGDEARVVMGVCSCLGSSSVHLAALRQPLLELAVALVSACHSPGSVTLQNLRLALLGKLAGDLKDLLVEAKGAELAPLRVELLRSLLVTAGGDPSQDVRRAAHAVLEAAALSSADVLTLLTQRQEEQHGQRKRRKAAAGKLSSPEVVLDHLDEVVLVLELLQWKTLDRPQALVAPLEQLLRQLAVAAAPLAVAFTEVDEEEDGEAMEGVGGQDAAPKSATSGYALQLVIGLLNTLAKWLPASEAAFDIGGAVLCARNAADAAASNAALQLLATLAARHPEDALKHALMVVEIVYQSEGSLSALDNTQSRAAAAAVMSAMLPPWLASQGGDAGRLWSRAVDALPSAQPAQRLGLLSMLLTAMPKEHGVTVAVLQLLQRAAVSSAAAGAAPDTAAALASEDCMALANDLFAQVPLDERLQALAVLLARSLEEAGGQQPHDVLPRLAVALATTQVKALPRRAAVQGGCEEAVAAGCQALMRQALAQLPALSVLSAAVPARKQRLAVSAATSALYTLIEALDTLMPAMAYLESLSTLLQQAQDDRMRRRLLKLLAARLQSLQDGDELEMAAAGDQEPQLANAALLLTEALPVLLSPATSSAATRQLALGTLGSAARCFAALAPAPLLGAVPAVLGAARDGLGAVRGSALVCIAALASSLQQRMLPLLPQVVATVLEVTEAAQRSLAGLDTTEQRPAADKDEASASEDEEGAAEPMSSEATVEERAVELAGGLAALDALLRALGAFLSPYLPALLQLLLRPGVLRCEVAGCSRFAAAIRGRIPEAVPPRLLLDPLFKQLQPAMEAGRAPALALLQMAADTVAAMDTKTAAAYHEQLFACVLRALDVREGGGMNPGDAAAVEGAAVEVLLALVMKLSERLFKPLFLRLLTWASVTPDTLAEDGTTVAPRPVGRLIALFSASAALGRRLRSVFVPYLRYLLDVAVQQLGGAAGSEPDASQTKKKRKKAAAVEGPAAVVPMASAADAGLWLLRLKVLRALHRGLLHDTVGFLTQDRFERLMPVLVAQLEAAPPSELQAQLAEEVVDEELDGTLLPAKHLSLDPAGRVAVAAVVQLALTANSDVLWKPLQHRALMLTRSAEPRCRLAALEVVGQLAARLREEYLTLMPEALPFLAELLEDVEPAVEGRAQELVALLEEVSGEKLDQYLKA